MDHFVIPKGTIVKLDGIPVEIENDTAIFASRGNIALAAAKQDKVQKQK